MGGMARNMTRNNCWLHPELLYRSSCGPGRRGWALTAPLADALADRLRAHGGTQAAAPRLRGAHAYRQPLNQSSKRSRTNAASERSLKNHFLLGSYSRHYIHAFKHILSSKILDLKESIMLNLHFRNETIWRNFITGLNGNFNMCSELIRNLNTCRDL